jgi:hypothetical protein
MIAARREATSNSENVWRNVKSIIGAKNHCGGILFLTVIFWLGMSVTPVLGDIVYSGVQDISLQGVANTNQVWNIVLAADPTPWDTLNLEIAQAGSGGGANNIFPGAQVALASNFSTSPLVTRFNSEIPSPPARCLEVGERFCGALEPGQPTGISLRQ